MTQFAVALPRNALRGKRGLLDIVNLILTVCSGGEKKTHVMYRCNLNSRQTQDYFALLLKHQLLAKSSGLGNDIYQTTERGKKFVGAYGELSQILDLIADSKVEV